MYRTRRKGTPVQGSIASCKDIAYSRATGDCGTVVENKRSIIMGFLEYGGGKLEVEEKGSALLKTGVGPR
jgi:hypothetical protein